MSSRKRDVELGSQTFDSMSRTQSIKGEETFVEENTEGSVESV